MRAWNMNTYMYAPKDDTKHRLYWRDLYTVEEVEELQSLVAAAKENDIEFYYALSPGLDMMYSSPKEVATLKRKLEQIASFGVKAFALLFDDIEPEIGEADKEVFQTFAQAHVSVTNEVFQALGQLKFLFCPTEYCASRAVPNVQNSEYLSTIGQKLLPGIDVMWTGGKVISKTIGLKSIRELQEVLRRPPVIWDNLHANDYDHKRIFLGPYSGRSTRLIPHLRGVLTNPNCEYEANYIAIHTLSQWSKCTADACKNGNVNSCGSSGTRTLEATELTEEEEVPAHLPMHSYHPRRAVQVAIQAWLSEFNATKSAYGRLINTDSLMPSSVNPLNPETAEEIFAPPLSSQLVNTLVGTAVKLEPMDCNPTPPQSASPSREDELINEDPVKVEEDMQTEESTADSTSEDLSIAEDPKGPLTASEISLLVDLFYLPFEHGRQGAEFLHDFAWLKLNAHYVATKRNNTELDEWYRRATKFDHMTQRVNRLSEKLMFISNRSLLYDLNPYVWDIKGVISLINSYIKWIGYSKGWPTFRSSIPSQGISNTINLDSGYGKQAFLPGEQEPWIFQGGLIAELQRLLPLESVNDLFLYKAPDTPNSKTYSIRPYAAADEEAVYMVCNKTCIDGEDGTMEFEGYPNLIADKTIGGFLALSSEFSFVVEDEQRIVGYALASVNAVEFFKRLEIAWNMELKEKYPLEEGDKDSNQSKAGEIISSFHSTTSSSWTAYPQYPSVLVMALLPHIDDCSLPKRLLACVIAALKANGSHGVHVKMNVNDTNMQNFYARLGFHEICKEDEEIILGRTF
ncbi:protein O-GlcNAcase [Galendromus occidentalis]|uniref:protein O-GlcNAcase n=1 Tax=Galendromus occidentalis TaxID=34638 RepID=A0AAJ7WIN6_9ACAR|nr:protein O-GlcNAcase [Galendromus occidentalis]